MRARESSRPSADRSAAAGAVALGLALLSLSWVLVHSEQLRRNEIVDTPGYERYAERIAAGDVPYRDFVVEYPPAALPVFWLPQAIRRGEPYREPFDALMWLCAAATVVLAALTLVAARASGARLYAATAFVGLAPLALGPVVTTRFDFWPAALAAGALAAVVAGRARLGLGVLALGVAAKLYPVVVLPAAYLYARVRHGAREARNAALVFVAVLAVVVLPFALVGGDGFVDSVGRQAGRPLQIESLGASVLLVAHRLGAAAPTVVTTHGSQNLSGAVPDAIAAVQTLLQALAVAAVWVLFARSRRDVAALLAAAAAAVAAFVAFGKVLSPQFLIWLLPLVPLVGGRVGAAATAILGVALVLTQLWFPSRYFDVVALGPEAWLVLARNVVLVALFVVLALALARMRRAGELTPPARGSPGS